MIIGLTSRFRRRPLLAFLALMAALVSSEAAAAETDIQAPFSATVPQVISVAVSARGYNKYVTSMTGALCHRAPVAFLRGNQFYESWATLAIKSNDDWVLSVTLRGPKEFEWSLSAPSAQFDGWHSGITLPGTSISGEPTDGTRLELRLRMKTAPETPPVLDLSLRHS